MIRITYYLPNQSNSEPKTTVLEDIPIHRELVENCRNEGYKILLVEEI